ncbi:hypothetical protein Cni_G00854 [Canna indica]|uniref:Uncharacterized protein n=1 Tax=Canna indica TaxID=4628 RepID=A0AAQ3JLR3_9LILI|nr:hypothetical protein Cni_G00854 [Canna indica]
MKGKVGRSGGASTDLLVCFPSRAHLTLMPKPLRSPSPAIDAGKRGPPRPGIRVPASPLLFKTKAKSMSSEIAEPTSPKVTCAGQIKMRNKSLPSKNWLSVVEEIEKLHEQRKSRRPHWLGTFGLKKDVMHFIAAVRGLRFNMDCFCSFHGAVDCATDDKDGKEDEGREGEASSASQTTPSKCLLQLLEENRVAGCKKRQEDGGGERDEGRVIDLPSSLAPPPNALLLMRCRSAPAKGELKEREHGRGREMASKMMIKEDETEKERLLSVRYDDDFFKISNGACIAKDMNPFTRSRSCRR